MLLKVLNSEIITVNIRGNFVTEKQFLCGCVNVTPKKKKTRQPKHQDTSLRPERGKLAEPLHAICEMGLCSVPASRAGKSPGPRSQPGRAGCARLCRAPWVSPLNTFLKCTPRLLTSQPHANFVHACDRTPGDPLRDRKEQCARRRPSPPGRTGREGQAADSVAGRGSQRGPVGAYLGPGRPRPRGYQLQPDNREGVPGEVRGRLQES